MLKQGWEKYVTKLMTEEAYLTRHDYSVSQPVVGVTADLVTVIDELKGNDLAGVNVHLRSIRRIVQRKVLFVIPTENAAWWRDRLGRFFYFSLWEVRPGFCYGEGVPLTRELRLGSVTRGSRPRREITPEWRDQIEYIKSHNNAHCDAFSRLETGAMWESRDDQPADLQVACNIIEYLPMDDVDPALADLARHARKAVLITVKLDPVRTIRFWRQVFERRFRTADVQLVEGHMLYFGAPMVSVDGVTAVGAVQGDDRWEQVKASSARVPRRIEPCGPHDRRAILVCYGPSLAQTVDRVRYLPGDIFSVSGAHDFLLEHGVTPHFHIECDPRPHKADNIKCGNRNVTYLLGSACHPVLFDKLEGCDTRLWHVSTPEHHMRTIVELGENPTHIISGGGSVGLRAIPLLYALGYRAIDIFGMDCSFAEDGEQHAGRHAGKLQDLCQVDCNGRLFLASPVLLTYATNFFEIMQKVSDLEIRLYGDGLLQAMCRYHMGAPQTERITHADDAHFGS